MIYLKTQILKLIMKSKKQGIIFTPKLKLIFVSGRIVKDLKLKNPIFQQSATYGHFGREIFTWEQPKTLKF